MLLDAEVYLYLQSFKMMTMTQQLRVVQNQIYGVSINIIRTLQPFIIMYAKHAVFPDLYFYFALAVVIPHP